LYVNGRSWGSRWCSPYRFDITEAARAGDNYLVIELANTLSNRMVGDAQLPEKYRQTKSNVIKGPTAWSTPWAELDLLESGLLGPVTVEFGHSHAID
jgi:hypothetical protein